MSRILGLALNKKYIYIMTFKDYYKIQNNQMTFLEEQILLEKLIKIVGPALYYKPAKILAKSGIGTTHAMLWEKLSKLIQKKLKISQHKADEMLQQMKEDDYVEGFMTTEGKFVDRQQAWNIAKKYNAYVKAMAQRGVEDDLASEELWED